MIRFEHRGDFKRSDNFFERMLNLDIRNILNKYGQLGVDYLARNTPKDTGETAASWSYSINVSGRNMAIYWTNSKMAGTAPLAVMLQYGHGTRNGGYVQGQDYINPAMILVFEGIARDVWEEVTNI